MRPLRPVLRLCWLACMALGCDKAHVAPNTAAEPGVSVATPVVRDVIDCEYFTGRTDAEKTSKSVLA